MKLLPWFGPALGVATFAAFLAACGEDGDDDLEVAPGTAEVELTSTAFEDGGPIPEDYTCDGEDRRPPLFWSGVPAEAKSLALILDDPDAGNFVHWVVYGMPPLVDTPEGFEAATSNASIQGKNGFGEFGYGGPCPPEGDEPHRYRFRLFALDAEPALEPGASAADLEDVMEGHILAAGELTGTFGR